MISENRWIYVESSIYWDVIVAQQKRGKKKNIKIYINCVLLGSTTIYYVYFMSSILLRCVPSRFSSFSNLHLFLCLLSSFVFFFVLLFWKWSELNENQIYNMITLYVWWRWSPHKDDDDDGGKNLSNGMRGKGTLKRS